MNTIQLCIYHRLIPTVGKTKETSACSCRQIKETESGVYWVQNQQVFMYGNS